MNVRKLAAAVCRLHDALHGYRDMLSQKAVLDLARDECLSQWQRSIRRHRQAIQLRLNLAAERLQRSVVLATETLSDRAMFCRHRLASVPRAAPSPAFLLGELKEVVDEFGDCQYFGREQELCSTTEPIVLDGIALGPFAIRLSLGSPDQPGGYPCYRVVALEPYAAATDSSILHPHVNGEQLCAGDGANAVSRALREGRISDFFLLVRSILATYNPASAYVKLSEWDGVSCADCGDFVDRDDLYRCEECRDELCPHCANTCTACERCCCDWHSSSCRECSDSYCEGCSRERLTDGYCEECRRQLGLDDEETETTMEEEKTDEIQVPV